MIELKLWKLKDFHNVIIPLNLKRWNAILAAKSPLINCHLKIFLAFSCRLLSVPSFHWYLKGVYVKENTLLFTSNTVSVYVII